MTKRKVSSSFGECSSKDITPSKRRTRRERQNTEFHLFRESGKRLVPSKLAPTLLEQVNEKSKLYESNVAETQAAFWRELLPLMGERRRLFDDLKRSPENIALICRKDREIKEIVVRLQYLQSGEAAKQLEQYKQELNQRGRMVATISGSGSGPGPGSDTQMLLKPQQEDKDPESKISMDDLEYFQDSFDLDEKDPLFSHMNVDSQSQHGGPQRNTNFASPTLSSTPLAENLFKNQKSQNIKNDDTFLKQFTDPHDRDMIKGILASVTAKERQALIRPLDVAYTLDPILFALSSEMESSKPSTNLLSPGFAGEPQRNLCTSCHQPMQMNSDVSIIFCLYCGAQRFATEQPPSHFEDPTRQPKVSNPRTKEDTKITSVLGDRRMIPMVNLAPTNFVEAHRSVQDLRCLRSREMVTATSFQTALKLQQITAKPPSAKLQMATYMNGVPPEYFSVSDEALLVGEMKKDSSLISEMRILNQKSRLGQLHPWVSGTAQDFLAIVRSKDGSKGS